MQQLSDDHLMELVQQGNNKALGQLMANNKPALYNFFYRMSADLLTANDLLQVTFSKMYLYRGSYRQGKNFFSWLYQIARNVWASHYQRMQPDLLKPGSGIMAGQNNK